MADTKTGRMVKLESSDKREFTVPVEIASMSVTIKNMLEGMLDFCLIFLRSLFQSVCLVRLFMFLFFLNRFGGLV
jgi:antibiotic biosynthesis monooxygenase (ABM) superfamily enzyme